MEGVALNQQTEARASKGVQIITMLYDGAINFINIAKEKIEVGDSVGRTHYINKSSAIVKELSSSLHMDGGDIALNLKNLYDFVLESLIKADESNNLDALSDAEKVVEILRSAWYEIQEAKEMESQQRYND